MRAAPGGAGFEIEGSIAGKAEIEQLLDGIVQKVERRRRRFQEENASGEREESDFRQALAKDVRDELYERLFPEGRIKVVHPQMREGRPFYFDKAVVSGGQASALMLQWTIKLAAYAVERGISRQAGIARSRLRQASHSIIIVDGLFSDLSDPLLIRESMEAMKQIRGNFQLIGLIHSPYYRNDWELFPTHLVGRRTEWEDGSGATGRMVTIAAESPERAGAVAITGIRAHTTLSRGANPPVQATE